MIENKRGKKLEEDKKWEKLCEGFRSCLIQEEKSKNTILKYISDVKRFLCFWKEREWGREFDKEVIMEYKNELLLHYKISSVNSKLISLNRFLVYSGYTEYKVKTIRTQKQTFCKEETMLHRKDYERLLKQAQQEGKEKLAMIMRVLACTGIRISELQFLTIEAVEEGIMRIINKGKYREILIPRRLREKLTGYAVGEQIISGTLFITRKGNPIDRSNLWHQLKALAKHAQVKQIKVFPHNFRHMFARAYYQQEKDIVRLADLLGHTSITTTRIYMISTGTEHMRQLEALNMAL